jgi:hypothetical protein
MHRIRVFKRFMESRRDVRNPQIIRSLRRIIISRYAYSCILHTSNLYVKYNMFWICGRVFRPAIRISRRWYRDDSSTNPFPKPNKCISDKDAELLQRYESVLTRYEKLVIRHEKLFEKLDNAIFPIRLENSRWTSAM